MIINRGFFLVIAVLAVAALACQATSSGGDTTTSEETVPQVETLFDDDFSDSNSGWDDIEDEEAHRLPGWQPFNKQTDWYFYSGKIADIVIEVMQPSLVAR
jgi:hypothetical protein